MPMPDHPEFAPSIRRGTLCVATAMEPVERRSVFAQLMQLYLHDFSEFAAVGTEHGEIGPEGTFPYDWLESYWTETGRIAISIRANDRLAGFALLNRHSALNRHVDHAVAEFFVLRKYRRHGVGSRAAMQLFARYPGRWEIPVAAYNEPALAFWSAVVRAATGWSAERIEGDGQRWSGPVLCFDNRPSPD